MALLTHAAGFRGRALRGAAGAAGPRARGADAQLTSSAFARSYAIERRRSRITYMILAGEP